MASRKNQNQNQTLHPALRRHRLDPLSLATLAGVVGVLMISFSSLRAIDSLDDKLDQVEDRIAEIDKTQLRAQATPVAAAPPPRSGPDPAKVYSIKATNAPSKGAANAAITIAEFSDFQ